MGGRETGRSKDTTDDLARRRCTMALALTSAAFGSGDAIPSRYTCDGEGVSPPLAWSGAPDDTETLVLICDDPDVTDGPWSHWVLYEIPETENGLDEDVPAERRLSWGGTHGRNDFGNPGYGAPCPSPPGSTHHYYFRLYALDDSLDLPPGATRQQILDRMRGHILARTELVGLYTCS
jgi:Raf kinase inhibitor-like YbhB/YbcL family protein